MPKGVLCSAARRRTEAHATRYLAKTIFGDQETTVFAAFALDKYGTFMSIFIASDKERQGDSGEQ